MKIYMKNPKGRLSDSCCLLKDFCQKLLFISFQKKVEINVTTAILRQHSTYQNVRL